LTTTSRPASTDAISAAVPGEMHVPGQSQGDGPGLETAPVVPVAGEFVATTTDVRRALLEDHGAASSPGPSPWDWPGTCISPARADIASVLAGLDVVSPIVESRLLHHGRALLMERGVVASTSADFPDTVQHGETASWYHPATPRPGHRSGRTPRRPPQRREMGRRGPRSLPTQSISTVTVAQVERSTGQFRCGS